MLCYIIFYCTYVILLRYYVCNYSRYGSILEWVDSRSAYVQMVVATASIHINSRASRHFPLSPNVSVEPLRFVWSEDECGTKMWLDPLHCRVGCFSRHLVDLSPEKKTRRRGVCAMPTWKKSVCHSYQILLPNCFSRLTTACLPKARLWNSNRTPSKHK